MSNLDAKTARQLLRYEPETGRLFWLERPREMFPAIHHWKTWNTRYAGTEAFPSTDAAGYRQGRIFDVQYRAHRVVWLIQTGNWPDGQIDHINGIRDDNRLSNLRVVSNIENGRNQSRYSTNTSGVTGVYWHRARQKWAAGIKINGRIKYLGLFNLIEDAAATRASSNLAHGFSERHGK